ncbi:branched-chain amino acid ABC transporter permease [Xanthobacteraceae bacterium A53D]
MASTSLRPCGDYRSSYRADQTLFDTRLSMLFCVAGVVALLFAPYVFSGYILSLMIQIGYLGIAALGLNILVGFSGQISVGHAVFYGFGGFASCFLSHQGVPVPLAIVLAGLWTTAVGLLFGLPAARVKGLYLAIATLAAQFILQDFFVRATWFSGGTHGSVAEPFTLFGLDMSGDQRYFYVVLFFFVVLYLGAANLMRSRDGRALIAVRDHYLSAEMMGVNLTKYRTMAFGISSFYAGIAGALYAHYIGYMSVEGIDILLSIQFLAMIIIGGLGSVMGSILGTIFMVLLPELTGALASALQGSAIDRMLHLKDGITYLREMLIGAVIILFLIFEPDGLAHRWRQIKAYWKLYPFSY